jgi:hypothetical protein
MAAAMTTSGVALCWAQPPTPAGWEAPFFVALRTWATGLIHAKVAGRVGAVRCARLLPTLAPPAAATQKG